MKVLHVLDTSVPDTAGYTTRGYYLVKHQKNLGVEPVVLTSERFRGTGSGLEEELEGVKYYRTRANASLLRKFPVLNMYEEVGNLHKRIAEVAVQERVDLIHAHSPSLIGAAARKFCKVRKIPLVYEIRAFWEDAAVDRGAFNEGSLLYRLRRDHEDRVVRAANKVIVICDGLKNDLLQRGVVPEKIEVVRNGVDHERFVPLATDRELARRLNLEGMFVLGFIGSFFHFEGLQDLIRAMALVIRDAPDVRLLLVGTGQVERQLKELTSELKLEDKVIFTGRVPHAEVNGYYSVTDVLVYPRIRKRITDLVTPLKPLEAMSMAKPVLMSDVGGLKELADVDGVAEFYEAENVQSLAVKCLELRSRGSSLQEMGDRARLNTRKSWGWDKRAEEDVTIYRSLI